MITYFDNSRWDATLEAYEAWWADELDRPLLNITVNGADPGIDKPEGEVFPLFYQYDLAVPVETIIKHCEYTLCSTKYICDAYPNYLPDFGPGVNAEFLGASFTVGPNTVWFGAREKPDMETFRLQYRSDSTLFRRIMEFYQKADAYFKGDVVLGMTHLNNGIDIPASFFGGAELCIALYDHPDDVERLIWENFDAFLRYGDEFSKAFKHNRGFTHWGNILAKDPWMSFQCDFSCMLSNRHFEQFVKPELAACCRAFPRYNFYHIDGKEQLRFLDDLLALPDIQAFQWQPGVDKRPEREWIPLYKKIRGAGKKIWFVGSEDGLAFLADSLGSLKGVYWKKAYPLREEESAYKAKERFTVR